MARTYPNPRNWSEMSWDFRAMFGFHIGMMALWMGGIGGALGVPLEAGIAATLFGATVIISTWRKRAAGWRWRGVGVKEIASAFFGLLATVVFLFAVTPLAPPFDPRMFPWYLAGAGIGLFNVLASLHLVTTSEAEFRDQCGEALQTYGTKPSEAAWKTPVRWVYAIAFLAVWLDGVAFFYFFGMGIRGGTHSPTAQNTETLFNHGEVVYVTMQTKHLIDVLQTTMAVGIPGVFLIGAFLHFGLKVRVFGDRYDKAD